MTLLGSLLDFRAVTKSDVWKDWARGADVSLGSESASGITVSRESAMKMSAVYAAVRLLSEDVATLPVAPFVASDDARERVPRPRWMREPNSEMSWVDVVQQLMAGLLTEGDGAWEVVRDRSARPVEVWPRDPSLIELERDLDGRLQFRVTDAVSGRDYVVSKSNMLWVRGFTLPGKLRGLSPIAHARETIGMGLAAEQYGARLFSQGATAGGVIEFPGTADDNQVSDFLRRWKRHHQGLHNAHEPGVLTGGATWKQTTIPPEDAQFIESRRFSISEIARFYRVPPHKIGDLENATFSNIEHQAIEYVVDGLRPWLVRLESALGRLLPNGQFVKWNVEGLLRGDTLARFQAYTNARNAGWMSVNEIRSLEDMNPIDDGDNFLQPLNMAPLGTDPTQGRNDDA